MIYTKIQLFREPAVYKKIKSFLFFNYSMIKFAMEITIIYNDYLHCKIYITIINYLYLKKKKFIYIFKGLAQDNNWNFCLVSLKFSMQHLPHFEKSKYTKSDSWK